ncbi:MAG: hypothetical protein VX730_01220 [Pseudomonadota bacterium]|nr:hypothetical protein [Pseudomonadota bacterium]
MATKAKKEDKLHYDKEALHKDYTEVYNLSMKAVGAIILLGVGYFFIMVTFLGGSWHTKYEPFVEQFGDRVEIEYEGLKLPIHGEGASEPAHH